MSLTLGRYIWFSSACCVLDIASVCIFRRKTQTESVREVIYRSSKEKLRYTKEYLQKYTELPLLAQGVPKEDLGTSLLAEVAAASSYKQDCVTHH
jgi:hypothetical protein